jgi:hypothetical protein
MAIFLLKNKKTKERKKVMVALSSLHHQVRVSSMIQWLLMLVTGATFATAQVRGGILL